MSERALPIAAFGIGRYKKGKLIIPLPAPCVLFTFDLHSNEGRRSRSYHYGRNSSARVWRYGKLGPWTWHMLVLRIGVMRAATLSVILSPLVQKRKKASRVVQVALKTKSTKLLHQGHLLVRLPVI